MLINISQRVREDVSLKCVGSKYHGVDIFIYTAVEGEELHCSRNEFGEVPLDALGVQGHGGQSGCVWLA